MEPSSTEIPKCKIYLVTGGNGFLGSHVARRLYDQGNIRVRVIDIVPHASLEGPHCHEFILGDLRNQALCELAVRGVDTVLHFAANMGGMGTIHDENDFVLYEDNHLMTTNLLFASLSANVRSFVFASSACIYPEALQSSKSSDVSLKETDAWTHLPPKPQGLYGLEKFTSELLLYQFTSKMDIRIARFHNVFGPGGAWNNGREKAPAALLRKAWTAKILGASETKIEIWGDGQQRRSFLYVQDAVDGVMKILQFNRTSKGDAPFTFNIGSDTSISIHDLALAALECAEVGLKDVHFSYDTSKPVGVASRNSNNELAKSILGWSPRISLIQGMELTSDWIKQQIDNWIITFDHPADVVQGLSSSKIIRLQSAKIIFAILLPITSRGSASPSDCLSNLRRFSQSLFNTTWRDVRDRSSATQFRFVVYLAIDHDDNFLLPSDQSFNKAEQVLREEGICDVVTILCNHPQGHVCKIWRDCATRAWNDHCDYMVLMGDDVVLKDEGWMRDAHAEFLSLAHRANAPIGFGCVAFTDTSFPGMPTFPIINRTHMDIFKGMVIPDLFINQDGDPFLYQLYRRWGCSTVLKSRLYNDVGGEKDARYVKRHAQDWSFETLDNAATLVEDWLNVRGLAVDKKLTLDIVIPCYRVDLAVLDTILALQPSASCTVMFIIIIDNPSSPRISQLQARYSHRFDVRIRINESNLGASGSRNRGMAESAAEWVHFLDDDVVPNADILKRAEASIRAHPSAAGFVGTSLFPNSNTIFTTAVHLAGVTYFWDIARKMSSSTDLPWGVTANLIARRNRDGIVFDLTYPKTGGGEDIHFCRQKAQFMIQNGGEGFAAAPDVVVTHPWWNGGKRSYWRFYNWSVGDGRLIKNFPEHVYFDFAPNSAELLLGCAILCLFGVVFARWTLVRTSCTAASAVVISNVFHDSYRHLYRHPERSTNIQTSIELYSFFGTVAVVESSFIRMFSEIGRLKGLLTRQEYTLLGRRFDWFAGRAGTGPMMEEWANSLQRAILSAMVLRVLVALGL